MARVSEANESQYILEHLREYGYVSTGMELGSEQIAETFDSFEAVLQEIYEGPVKHGQRLIDALAVTYPGREHDSKGFIERRQIGVVSAYEIDRAPATESKDILHFTPQTYRYASEYFGGNEKVPAVLKLLLDQCVEIHEAAKKGMQPALKALGLDKIILAPKGSAMEDIHVLRLLKYPPMTPGELALLPPDARAELHFDRSIVTGAFCESEPGLVGGPANNHIGLPELTMDEFESMRLQALDSPIQHRRKHIKVFAGAGYNHTPEEIRKINGDLPLLLHGVKNGRQERKAGVLFCNAHGGIKGVQVPKAYETGYGEVYKVLRERAETSAA